MKIVNKLTIVFLTVLFIASCSEELLDVEPVNEFLSENYFSTEEQVFSSLIAAYDPLGWSMAYGQWVSMVMFGEIRSDNANAGGDPSDNDQPGWQEIDDLRETSSNTVVHPIYRKHYIGIFRSNLVINQPKIESEVIDRYKAEAKFLRALYHFELFKHFGPIPVVLETLTPDNINRSRDDMRTVFTAIVEDLNAAIPVLPQTLTNVEIGRASKGSAQALLGKVYLYWADMDNDDPAKFDLAAQNLREVVNSGEYQLVDDYKELFSYNFKNSSESVIEFQHSNLFPSGWEWFEGIDGNGIVQLCGIRGLCDNHPEYQAGWGFMLPTEELYNAYLPSDTYRRRASVVSVADLAEDIQSGCSVVVDETQNNLQDYTGYFQIKYANYKDYQGNNVNGGDPNLTKDPNTHYIRYSDVLLMLAESLIRGNGSEPEALGFIDQVRERGFGPGDNNGLFSTAQQVMATEGWSALDMVWYERRVELAMEGDRWYDLVRSGRVDSGLFTDDIRSSNYDENDLWMPIALEETSVATNLTTYPSADLFN